MLKTWSKLLIGLFESLQSMVKRDAQGPMQTPYATSRPAGSTALVALSVPQGHVSCGFQDGLGFWTAGTKVREESFGVGHRRLQDRRREFIRSMLRPAQAKQKREEKRKHHGKVRHSPLHIQRFYIERSLRMSFTSVASPQGWFDSWKDSRGSSLLESEAEIQLFSWDFLRGLRIRSAEGLRRLASKLPRAAPHLLSGESAGGLW